MAGIPIADPPVRAGSPAAPVPAPPLRPPRTASPISGPTPIADPPPRASTPPPLFPFEGHSMHSPILMHRIRIAPLPIPVPD